MPIPFFNADLLDWWTIILIICVFAVLVVLLVLGQFLKRQPDSQLDPAIVRAFHKRVIAWLTICVLLVVALSMNQVVTVILFGLLSFWALREFITMAGFPIGSRHRPRIP